MNSIERAKAKARATAPARARATAPASPGTSICIKGVPPSLSRNELKELLEPFLGIILRIDQIKCSKPMSTKMYLVYLESWSLSAKTLKLKKAIFENRKPKIDLGQQIFFVLHPNYYDMPIPITKKERGLQKQQHQFNKDENQSYENQFDENENQFDENENQFHENENENQLDENENQFDENENENQLDENENQFDENENETQFENEDEDQCYENENGNENQFNENENETQFENEDEDQCYENKNEFQFNENETQFNENEIQFNENEIQFNEYEKEKYNMPDLTKILEDIGQEWKEVSDELDFLNSSSSSSSSSLLKKSSSSFSTSSSSSSSNTSLTTMLLPGSWLQHTYLQHLNNFIKLFKSHPTEFKSSVDEPIVKNITQMHAILSARRIISPQEQIILNDKCFACQALKKNQPPMTMHICLK
jgi:hypothetical protein